MEVAVAVAAAVVVVVVADPNAGGIPRFPQNRML